MTIVEYLSRRNLGAYTDWDLEVRQRARMDSKLLMMNNGGHQVADLMLSPVSGFGLLRKLKVLVQKVQLRPLFCFGPFDVDGTLTFLMPAKEIQNDWSPKNAREVAQDRRTKILGVRAITATIYGREQAPNDQVN